MAASRLRQQSWYLAGSFLGRLLLCLSLLLNLSTVVVEDIKWSAVDQVLDAHHSVSVSVATKGNEAPDLVKKSRELNDFQFWSPPRPETLQTSALDPELILRDHRSAPRFDAPRLLAPFPPRAPTA